MPTRRQLIKAMGLCTLGYHPGTIPNHCGGKTNGDNMTGNSQSSSWLMPEEAAEHSQTWMSFGASRRIWGKRLLDPVRENIAQVARCIAKYEPVSICVREQEIKLAERFFEDSNNITLFPCPMDDIWIRDYGAVFVHDNHGSLAAIDFNFNGWGEKQNYGRDSKVAATMAKATRIPIIETDLCLEGGGIEVDGIGTAIITESCVINDNRNPGWSKAEIETELRRILGLKKVIWLPGVRDADITDGHTDFYARFAGEGTVVVHLDPNKKSAEHELTLIHLERLKDETDVNGQQLEVVTIEPPTKTRDDFWSKDFCAGYINFCVCNDAVIAPEFGDKTKDGIAHEILSELFPDRTIEMLNIDPIAAGGGGIHCVTQQQPLKR